LSLSVGSVFADELEVDVALGTTAEFAEALCAGASPLEPPEDLSQPATTRALRTHPQMTIFRMETPFAAASYSQSRIGKGNSPHAMS
jgi:hypothetical protein